MSEVLLHGGDPSVLRRLNSVATLRGLRNLGDPTLTELANAVGLSRPTTEGVLVDLIGRGLAEEVAPPAGKRLGRPARHYRFRAGAGYALGVEIKANLAVLLLADLNGRIVDRRRVALEIDAVPADRLATVGTLIEESLAESHLDRGDLWAVTVGTPGVVDPDGTLASCTVVPHWQGVDLGRRLGRLFACPVLVENDANLAAVAECWRGVASEVGDVVYVLTGLHTGIGAIIGGRLHRGRWGGAGEVGVLPELGLRDTSAELAGDRPTGVAVEAAAAGTLVEARAGDPTARDRVERLAARMARGVAAMTLALDPEVVVVGGALTLPGDLLVDALRRHVQPLCLRPPRVEASILGNEAVGLGALRLALNRIEQTLYRTDPTRT